MSYLFWSDVPTETARHNLRQLIKRLKVLSLPENLEIERDRLRWQVSSDVATFKKALLEKNLNEALASYTGEFLQGLESGDTNEFHTWLFNEREGLRSQWREAVLDYVQISEKTEAIKWLERLLELDPMDEEAVQLTMGLLADTKHYAKAGDIYQSFAKRLGDELGLTPTSNTQHLFQRIQSSKSTITTLERDTVSILPSIHDSLIGRELELSDIAYLLAQPSCQIITLTGPGGIGKTTLALEAMKDNASRFEQVTFVPLETLKVSSGVLPKIAEVLGLTSESSSSVLEHLRDTLKDKRIMLVLDNFEHVLDSATLIAELAASCPHVKILITSRERLNLEEEHLLVVSGLALPQMAHTLDEALATASIQLFVERAKRVQLHFAVNHQDLPRLIHLCQRLGGIPLALELAAVWVQVMSLGDINKELAKNLDLLESPNRNRNERHRSLRAVFETSWKLLTPTEQQSFSKLAVFSGSFKRQAAAEVAGATLPDLFNFVNKSLLQTRPNGSYHLHFYIYELSLRN